MTPRHGAAIAWRGFFQMTGGEVLGSCTVGSPPSWAAWSLPRGRACCSRDVCAGCCACRFHSWQHLFFWGVARTLVLSDKNTVGATYMILHFLIATLQKEEEIGEINFNHIFYLTQYFQNITSMCNQYKNDHKDTLHLFFILTLQTQCTLTTRNPMAQSHFKCLAFGKPFVNFLSLVPFLQ